MAVLPSPASKLSNIILVREGGDGGFLGTYFSDKSVVVEAQFNWHPDLKTLMDTPIVSMDIWRGKQTLFGFFNGFTVKMPSPDDAAQFVLPVVRAFSDYRPVRVSRDMMRR